MMNCQWCYKPIDIRNGPKAYYVLKPGVKVGLKPSLPICPLCASQFGLKGHPELAERIETHNEQDE